MSTLAQELDRYLKIRRSMGYSLTTTARSLRKFVEFARKERADHITTDLFLRWQKDFGHAHRTTWAKRLAMVRHFATWLRGIDSRNEVPPRALIPCRYSRRTPHIYRRRDIQRIIHATSKLPSIHGFRGLTYATLFGLVAVTGMRINEALALDTSDVDLETGVLSIRQGKLGKARLNPISDSTKAKLVDYANERDRLLGRRTEAFFLSECGERLTEFGARYNFSRVCQQLGLRPMQQPFRYGRGPRLHDLRHTFAVNTIVNWYRTGKDAGREMIKLTTYLGHTHPADTYWYIQAVPELLELASQRAVKALAKEVGV